MRGGPQRGLSRQSWNHEHLPVPSAFSYLCASSETHCSEVGTEGHPEGGDTWPVCVKRRYG